LDHGSVGKAGRLGLDRAFGMKTSSEARFETAIEDVMLSKDCASYDTKKCRSALITAAVTGKIPLEEMSLRTQTCPMNFDP